MTKAKAYEIVIADLQKESVCQLSAHTLGCFSCALARLAADLKDAQEIMAPKKKK